MEPVDENGHIIMDYSIHDAIEAGFNKVVFIIRKDIEEEFKEVIGDDRQGLLLLSYPAIESFTLSNFEHHVFEERKETGKELKQYLHSRHINHQNITEESLMCAVRELWEALQKIGKLKLDLDDFREVNKKIFDFEEKEMESNKAYRILSLLCVSLLDLGLLEIEEET